MKKSIQKSVMCPECGQPLALVDIKKHLGSEYGLKKDFFFSILWYCVDCKEHGETIARGGWIGLEPSEMTQVRKHADKEFAQVAKT